ncbi:Hypothetical_protein [Hexamita inflata]|uniref:Hypothetical_protein n=1 Tax=Hexamita inflata TaxID=28002 RepID=A0AA86R8H4_9EUKA|nr:Hypothetical protein HINF_LOCUS55599 [Hexamita inflata]
MDNNILFQQSMVELVPSSNTMSFSHDTIIYKENDKLSYISTRPFENNSTFNSSSSRMDLFQKPVQEKQEKFQMGQMLFQINESQSFDQGWFLCAKCVQKQKMRTF